MRLPKMRPALPPCRGLRPASWRSDGRLTTDGRVHVYDAGYCFAFAASMPAANFPIFNYAGAPDPTALGATAWTGAGIIAFVD